MLPAVVAAQARLAFVLIFVIYQTRRTMLAFRYPCTLLAYQGGGETAAVDEKQTLLASIQAQLQRSENPPGDAFKAGLLAGINEVVQIVGLEKTSGPYPVTA